MPNQIKKNESTLFPDHCAVTKRRGFSKPVVKMSMKFMASLTCPANVIVMDAGSCGTSKYFRKKGYTDEIIAFTNNSDDFEKMRKTVRNMDNMVCENIDADDLYENPPAGSNVLVDDGNNTWRKTRSRMATALENLDKVPHLIITNCVPRSCSGPRDKRGRKTILDHKYDKICKNMKSMGRDAGYDVIRKRIKPYQQKPGKSQMMYPDGWILRPKKISIDLTL